MSGLDIRDLMQAAAGVAADAPAQPRPASGGSGPAAIAESATGLPVAKSVSPVVLVGVVRFLEAVIVVGSGVLVHALYLARPLDANYWGALLGLGALALLTFQALGAYSIGAFRAFFHYGVKIVVGWGLVFLMALAAVFLLKAGDEFSRVWLVSWFATGLVALTGERLVVSLVFAGMSRAGRFDRRTAIVGGGPAAESMIKALDAQPDTGIKIVGVFDDRSDTRSSDVIGGYPKLGRVDDLVDYARRTQLDLVIFTVPISAEERLLQMLSKLWVLPIDIRLAAHTSKLRLRPRSYSYIGSVPVLGRLRSADRRLGPRGQGPVRQDRRPPAARRALARSARDRDRREARLEGADLLQAESATASTTS